MSSQATTRTLSLTINGQPTQVAEGTLVAAAVLVSGEPVFRKSISGQPRGPLCGMGICFECRLSIDGQAHRRSCQIVCREGMEISTDVA